MGGGERLIKGREIEMKAERERGGGGVWGALTSEAQHERE